MKKKCIVGRRHLSCRRELAEGEHSFRARSESNIRGRFASLFRIALSVERPVLCPFSTPCQIITPLVEIATWLPNPNPTPNPNPSPTPNPKPTNTRG